jgi:cytochrome c-type biogenesis protein CcmH/NrfG
LIGAALYAPAVHAPFIFDDNHLPFRTTSRVESLPTWLMGVRPVLMFSYWINYIYSGDNSFSYHVVNLVIHVVNTGLAFLVFLRLLEMAGWQQRQRIAASAAGALIFLIHPLQTESVTYIAGRSESLESLFLLLAYVVFLYRRRESIAWAEAIGVLLLLALAVGAKENAVALAGVLVLTDVFWPQPFRASGLRKNWRLYLLMAPLSLLAFASILRLLSRAPSAGFSLPGLNWYQYGFTEAGVLLHYVQLAVLPFGQSLDHDYPISATIGQHGAIFFVVLWAAVLAFAIIRRRQYPLACFGLLLFLILLAPTSTVVPLADPFVERRMYLPLIGLILVGLAMLATFRLRTPTLVGAFVALTLIYGAFCYERNREWGQPEQLLASATRECVRNPRPYIMLGEYLISVNRCRAALPYLEEAVRKMPNATLYVSWGRVLECMGEREQAMQKLKQAATMSPNSSEVFQLIGLLYGEMHMPDEAGAALRKAVSLDPKSTPAHSALALWFESEHDVDAAETEYRRASSLDPNDWESRVGLARVRQWKAAQQKLAPTSVLSP